MSKINVFPNTVIQTNGTTPYILRTIEHTGSLNHVEIESKTDETINIDLSDIIFDSVAIKGGSDLGETTLLWVRNSMNVQPWTFVENRILTCTDELKEQYADELQFLVSRGYNIDVPVSQDITALYMPYFDYSPNGQRYPAYPESFDVYRVDGISKTGTYMVMVGFGPSDIDITKEPKYWEDIELKEFVAKGFQYTNLQFDTTYVRPSSEMNKAGWLYLYFDVTSIYGSSESSSLRVKVGYKDKVFETKEIPLITEQPDIGRLEVYALGRLISGEPYGDYEVDTENLGVITQPGTYVVICGFGPSTIDTYKEPKYWEDVVIDVFDNIGFNYSNLQFDTTYVQVAQWWDTAGWLRVFFDITSISSSNGYLDISIKYKDIVSETKRFNISEQQPTVNLTLDLNNEWSRSNITNPDPDNYDMYESASNYHVNGATSSMYLVVQSNQDEYEFKFLVCADCEQYYDQVKAYEPGSETGVHANISKWGDGADLSNYTEVVYNPLQGYDTKRIKLSYVKDFSSYYGNDRGFLLVPKGTPFINEWQDS